MNATSKLCILQMIVMVPATLFLLNGEDQAIAKSVRLAVVTYSAITALSYCFS